MAPVSDDPPPIASSIASRQGRGAIFRLVRVPAPGYGKGRFIAASGGDWDGMLSLLIALAASVIFFRAARARRKSGWRWALAGAAAALGPGTLAALLFSQAIVPFLPADGALMAHYALFDLGYRICTVVIELVLVFWLHRRHLSGPAVPVRAGRRR